MHCRVGGGGLSRSAVARACIASGISCLPALQVGVPVGRYERQSPGELLHLGIKRLRCFEKPGHRLTGGTAQSHRPPITRLGFEGNNGLRNYSKSVFFSTTQKLTA